MRSEGIRWLDRQDGALDLPDEEPAAECSACHRKAWEPDMVGRICYMPQPNEQTCMGTFAPLKPIPKRS